MAKPIAQKMVVLESVIFRVKHQSNCGNWLFFVVDGIAKLDQNVMWCFSAANVRPIKPMFWYENDVEFVENHLTVHSDA